MRRRIKLKTISPVHIGGGTQELTPLESVVLNGRCYVVNEAGLGRALLKEGKLDILTGEIGKQGSRFSLENFLRGQGLLKQSFLEGCAAYSCETAAGRTPAGLRPFVRDAYGRPFVPGSSLKGVLRTAILYTRLKKMKNESPRDFQRCFTDVVRGKLNEFNRAEDWKRHRPWFKDGFKRNMAGQVERELLQRFDLPVPDARNRRGPTAQQRDVLRAVKVSDAVPLDKNGLVLEEVQVTSITGENESYVKTPVFVEVMPAGVEIDFEIILDEAILADFGGNGQAGLPFKTLEDIYHMLQEFSTGLWKFETDFWNGVSGPGTEEMREFYRREPAAMRLGWGSGLAGTGLFMLLPEALRRELRDDLFEPRGQQVFPKSRRVAVAGSHSRRPPGWVVTVE
ncbi:type III-A CRISPR-associated RAMP protein Csm5 [Desulfotomaculum copahuensis]|uniref:CRISPR system Cms protein Csm5 n=1 Tax=Desulfotomaculum copahuensis TaxID=1838280 RepID=A0A1B7LCF9_9FIRM|nr:type III-A CRISPR-associated RAMP protein Csm5 [Desulfotomaculum copahuensis]OAT80409.1 type III-A CRISPR-associated RAMP protein Csm5 [Desulfotomaculum copahuensis]